MSSVCLESKDHCANVPRMSNEVLFFILIVVFLGFSKTRRGSCFKDLIDLTGEGNTIVQAHTGLDTAFF